jgi:hypothetical protein
MLNETLLQGLDPAGRRRLWLLETLIQKLEPSAALDLAAKMESFVCGGHSIQISDPPADEPTPSFQGQVPVPSSKPDVADVVQRTSGAERSSSGRGPRLLDEKSLEEFTAALGAGADNTQLARQFGLTPRQANSLRMGIQKRLPHLRTAKVVKPKRPELDRSTELQMQEAFLSKKPPAAMTIEDVVRFLRQRGDVVVQSEDNFVVNGLRTLTTAELIARANAKRSELQLPAFPVIWGVASVASQGGTKPLAAPPPHPAPVNGLGPSEVAVEKVG